ncbi:MAG: primase protein [Candidatus Magasanikbacteria bacterium GW2011_GWA2_56_11]|uniref:DNA primase n=1 Tax=Candidatus Magasanikbacteria bacterium GW2011_GWA2_56_11 TaxID=1619044 RepID=A0A0G2B968_9BACT|nr:MAG: primase protein [Candidatus Magasanikbacteria bacterium GW2011_GWA2_56_11]
MSDTQLIKDKLDIVDLIGEYVQLKPAGVNHKGLCPFHHEKSPSFMVNRERQSWHCFGCSKGGDAFTFVEEMEGMEFVEALKYLANRAGVALSAAEKNSVETSQRNRLKEINREAARFFHNFLLKMEAARPAREYLAGRALGEETLEEWQIGFVPDQWDLLTKYLLKKGYSIDDLVASGLTIKRDSADQASGRGFYDRFRGRIMFPIWDIHDSVVGFTGRVLVETEHSGGKYVNTPQSPVYDKSRVVFGLNRAKKEIKAKNLIVVVEGQMDVIACHQSGMKNVVASSGTALTADQIALLKRYASALAIAFDADAAGQNAAKRGIDLAREAGLSVRVIRIPPGAGKDPDECLRQSPAVWERAVAEAEDIMAWYLQRALGNNVFSDARSKQLAVNEVMAEIVRIPYAVERDHWLKVLSERTGEEVQVLRENMSELKKSLRSASVPGRSGAPVLAAPKADFPNRGRLAFSFERLLALVLKFPPLLPGAISQLSALPALEAAVASLPGAGPLYAALKKDYTTNNSFDIDKLRTIQTETSAEPVADVLLMKADVDYFGVGQAEAAIEARRLLALIHDEWLRERRRVLQGRLREAESAGDSERVAALLLESQDLMRSGGAE